MNDSRRRFLSTLLTAAIFCLTATTHAGWQAGFARSNITPEQFMWMSGYGGRKGPAESKLTDLWAKVLVLQDENHRVALITLDLVGIDREVSLDIRNQVQKKYGLNIDQVAICTSHTHTGPVVGENLGAMYFLDDHHTQLVRDYAKQLTSDVVAAVGKAIKDLSPAKVSYGHGQTDFAVNRRNNREADVPELRKKNELRGPVDHDVPVLTVHDMAGNMKVIVCGYACHATVLSFNQWSGDWPGFAQMAIEQRHPETHAMFWAGCGADQNPLPRRTVELAEKYGSMLADAVDEVLKSGMEELKPKLETRYEEIDLAFGELPTREQIEEDTKSSNRFVASRANNLLKSWDKDGGLSPTYPYPVQVWKLGDTINFVILGGEVVVDFSIRLKTEIDGNVWVAGYSNDVMAYIPSLRVLQEGGYEGAGAMVYYGLPTAWSEQVEEHIVTTVKKLSE